MIRFFLDLYVLVIIADAILSFLPQFRHQPVVVFIRKIADLSCRPIRRLLPSDLPFDFSPLIVIIAIQLIKALW